MNIKPVLISQYRAALAMLREAIEQCPPEMWNEGAHGRASWRIAYHTIFYTHLYLCQREEDFEKWSGQRHENDDTETVIEPYSKEEVLAYLGFLEAKVAEMVNRLDLESQESGFDWYTLPKLDHQIMNIRHVQEHAGQLRERLFSLNLDLRWAGSR